jgi:hypothetical protein
MTRWYSTAVTALGLLIGCGQQSTDPATPPNGDPGTVDDPGVGSDPGPGSAANPPAATCPLGTATWTREIGLATSDQRSDVAVDAAGNVLFATMATRTGGADGLTKLSPSGEVLFTRPFGSVVATDRAGNAYIAGSFTTALDVGLGEMKPEGNIDVFVAKLDGDGHVVFARPLRLCGDGIESIAVDASGRIAVSGSALGTVLLAPDGALQSVLAWSGDVAFNSHGDLLIAGTFTTTIDLGDGPISAGIGNTEGFVIAVDPEGQRIWSHVLAGGAVHTNGVAVDTQDGVVLAGYYDGSIDLFGDEFHAIYNPEAGRVTGAYAVKLDPSGEVIWKIGRADGSEVNGVATDVHDGVIVTGASTGNAGFSRITLVTRFDATAAARRAFSMFPASGYGRGEAVAADACGSVYTTVNALDQASPDSPLRVYVAKLSP